LLAVVAAEDEGVCPRAQGPEIDRVEPPARSDGAARVAITDDLGEEVAGRCSDEGAVESYQQLALLICLVVGRLRQAATNIERDPGRGRQVERLRPPARHPCDRAGVDPAQGDSQPASPEPPGDDPGAASVGGLMSVAKGVIDIGEAIRADVEMRLQDDS